MTNRKSINIYIPKYFMAVRNFIHILVLYGLEIRLCRPAHISANYMTDWKFKCENKLFVVLFLILIRVLS